MNLTLMIFQFLPININNNDHKLESDICRAMLNLHALSGCDTTSSFVRHGKVTVKCKLEKCQKFVPILMPLGSELTITDMLMTDIEEFVYNLNSNHEYNDIDKPRNDLFTHKIYILQQRNM